MAKSTVLDLRAELEEKQKLVKQCEAALDGERAAAEEYVAKKIAKAKAALQDAKRDAEEYIAAVAQALGLPHPSVARQVKARIKRVRELLGEGKTEEQIAKEMDAPLALIHADVARLTPRTKDDQPIAEGQRGWKRDQVRKLTLDGLDRDEIAEKLGISRVSVNAHITQLRVQGKLPQPGDEADEPPAPPRTVPAPAPAAARPPVGSPSGDSPEALRAEVARQQAGVRSKGVKFLAGANQGHSHRVLVDRMGDGCTQADETGHVHKVYRFVVSMAVGHQHGLKVAASADLWD